MPQLRRADWRPKRQAWNALGNEPLLSVPLTSSIVPAVAPAGLSISFARAANASVFDHEGILRTAQSGEARIWGARRVHNRLVGGTFNPFGGASVTSSGQADCLGGSTAILANEGSGAGTHYFASDTIGTGVVGEWLLVSLYVKAGTAQRCQLTTSTGYVSTGPYANFGLTGAGSVLATGGGVLYANIAAVDAANGWYRIWFVAVVDTAGSGSACAVSFINSDTAARLPSYTGSSLSLSFCGHMVEYITGLSVLTPNEYTSVGVLSAPYHGANFDGVRYVNTVRLHTQNYLTYSEDFTQSVWTGTIIDGALALASGVISPDGTQAWTFRGNTNNTSHRFGPLTSIGPGSIAGTTFEASLDVKAGVRNECCLRIMDSAFLEGVRINVTDINAGTAFRLDSGAIVNGSYGIVDLGNGWKRITVRGTFSRGAAETGNLYWIAYGHSTAGTYVGTNADDFYFARPILRSVTDSVLSTYASTGATANFGVDTGGRAPIAPTVLLGLCKEKVASQLVTPSASIRDLTDASWVATGTFSTRSKTAYGVNDVANVATRLTASAVNAQLMQAAPVTAAGVYVASFYIRKIVQTGNIEITVDGGLTWSNIAAQLNAATYTRVYVLGNLALNTARIGIRIAAIGDSIEVDFAQLESALDIASAPSSPMATAGASVRPADVYGLGGIWTTVMAANGFAMAEFQAFRLCTGTASYVLLAEGATNGTLLLLGSTSTVQSSDATSFPGAGGTVTLNTMYKLAVRWGLDSDAVNRFRVYRGSTASVDTAFDGTMGTTVTQFRIGANSGGGGAIDGCVRNVKIWGNKATHDQALVAVS